MINVKCGTTHGMMYRGLLPRNYLGLPGGQKLPHRHGCCEVVGGAALQACECNLITVGEGRLPQLQGAWEARAASRGEGRHTDIPSAAKDGLWVGLDHCDVFRNIK